MSADRLLVCEYAGAYHGHGAQPSGAAERELTHARLGEHGVAF